MSSKHEEWRCVEVDSGWLIETGDGHGSNYIGDVHKHVGKTKDDARDEARANLIAAAPSLLKALVGLNQFLANYPHELTDDISSYIDAADEAIAKATGEQP